MSIGEKGAQSPEPAGGAPGLAQPSGAASPGAPGSKIPLEQALFDPGSPRAPTRVAPPACSRGSRAPEKPGRDPAAASAHRDGGAVAGGASVRGPRPKDERVAATSGRQAQP